MEGRPDRCRLLSIGTGKRIWIRGVCGGILCGEFGPALVIFLLLDGVNQYLMGGLDGLKLWDDFGFMARITIWVILFGWKLFRERRETQTGQLSSLPNSLNCLLTSSESAVGGNSRSA